MKSGATWSWLWQFPELKPCYKNLTQLSSLFNPGLILFVPSFGPDLSLKQSYPRWADITILVWKLRSNVHVHTKLVLKLVFSGRVEDLLQHWRLPDPRKSLTFFMSVITWDSVKTVLAQCPERNAFPSWYSSVFRSIKFVK